MLCLFNIVRVHTHWTTIPMTTTRAYKSTLATIRFVYPTALRTSYMLPLPKPSHYTDDISMILDAPGRLPRIKVTGGSYADRLPDRRDEVLNLYRALLYEADRFFDDRAR
jgi:hypothetical protein